MVRTAMRLPQKHENTKKISGFVLSCFRGGFTNGIAGTWLVVAGLVSAGSPVAAHHSYTAFESKSRITVTGKVAAFEWINPHVIIEIDGAEENGGLRRWTVELG